jgi:hypothetical protein
LLAAIALLTLVVGRPVAIPPKVERRPKVAAARKVERLPKVAAARKAVPRMSAARGERPA